MRLLLFSCIFFISFSLTCNPSLLLSFYPSPSPSFSLSCRMLRKSIGSLYPTEIKPVIFCLWHRYTVHRVSPSVRNPTNHPSFKSNLSFSMVVEETKLDIISSLHLYLPSLSLISYLILTCNPLFYHSVFPPCVSLFSSHISVSISLYLYANNSIIISYCFPLSLLEGLFSA